MAEVQEQNNQQAKTQMQGFLMDSMASEFDALGIEIDQSTLNQIASEVGEKLTDEMQDSINEAAQNASPEQMLAGIEIPIGEGMDLGSEPELPNQTPPSEPEKMEQPIEKKPQPEEPPSEAVETKTKEYKPFTEEGIDPKQDPLALGDREARANMQKSNPENTFYPKRDTTEESDQSEEEVPEAEAVPLVEEEQDKKEKKKQQKNIDEEIQGIRSDLEAKITPIQEEIKGLQRELKPVDRQIRIMGFTVIKLRASYGAMMLLFVILLIVGFFLLFFGIGAPVIGFAFKIQSIARTLNMTKRKIQAQIRRLKERTKSQKDALKKKRRQIMKMQRKANQKINKLQQQNQ